MDGEEETSLRVYVSGTAISKIIRRTHVYSQIIHSAAVFDMKLLVVLVRISLVDRPESSTVIRRLTRDDGGLLQRGGDFRKLVADSHELGSVKNQRPENDRFRCVSSPYIFLTLFFVRHARQRIVLGREVSQR